MYNTDDAKQTVNMEEMAANGLSLLNIREVIAQQMYGYGEV